MGLPKASSSPPASLASIHASREKSNRKVLREGLAFLVKPGQNIPVDRLLFAHLLEALRRQQGYIPERHHPLLVQLGPCFGAELRLQVISTKPTLEGGQKPLPQVSLSTEHSEIGLWEGLQ